MDSQQPTGDARKLTPPPKFGTVGGSPAPQGIGDWVSFFRWLFSLWRVASVSIDAPEAISITQRPGSSISPEELIAAAGVLSSARAGKPTVLEVDLADIRAKQERSQPAAQPDPLNALSLLALGRYQSPAPPPIPNGALLGPHIWRQTLITATAAGAVLTRSAGDFFFPEMLGKQIAVAVGGVYDLYFVVTYTDASHVTLSSAPGGSPVNVFFSLFPPINYPEGMLLWETDRTLMYIDDTGTGTLDTAGTAAAWVSGGFFNPYWKGKRITINGVEYGIAAVPSPISMTLSTSAGTQSGVAYSIDSGVWRYSVGVWKHTGLPLPAIPAGLGIDDAGIIIFEDDFQHAYLWDGAGWSYAPGDPGSGFIVAIDGGLSGGDWGICDGTSHLASRSNGTAGTITTPNLAIDTLLQGGGAGHRVATRAQWETGAVTDDESTHTHPTGVTTATGDVGAGPGTFNYVDGVDDPTGAGSAHYHVLSDANAQLKKFSEAGGGMPDRTSLNWYIRL